MIVTATVAGPAALAVAGPVAVGYAGPGPDGRTVWLRLEIDQATGEAHGLLRSAAARTGLDGTPSYDVAFAGTVRAEPGGGTGEADGDAGVGAAGPERLRVDARGTEPSWFGARTDPGAADAPAVELALIVDATPWTDPPRPDPHGRATVTIVADDEERTFELPAVATRLASITELGDGSFEVTLDLPFFYAEPYVRLDLAAPHLDRVREAWQEGLRQRRDHPTSVSGSWWLERRDEVRSIDPGLVSVLTVVNAYAGGAHPNMWYETRTWILDAEGDETTWRRAENVCDALGALELPCDADWLRTEVIRELERQGAGAVEAGEVGPEAPWLLDAFTIGPNGVTFHFAPYEVGPYVQGPFDVLVRY